jgi:hypothetical protein
MPRRRRRRSMPSLMKAVYSKSTYSSKWQTIKERHTRKVPIRSSTALTCRRKVSTHPASWTDAACVYRSTTCQRRIVATVSRALIRTRTMIWRGYGRGDKVCPISTCWREASSTRQIFKKTRLSRTKPAATKELICPPNSNVMSKKWAPTPK